MYWKWIITAQDPPSTVSEWLVRQGISTTQRRKIRRHGILLCNGKNVPFYYRIQIHDQIEIHLPETSLLAPWHTPLEIVYEDDFFLFVNKPAGMLSHATAKERHHTLLHAVQAYFNKTGQNATPHPIHRLDRNTSGLLLLAKSAPAQYDFEKKSLYTIQRQYIAFVSGRFSASLGSIHFPIARKKGSIIEREVNFESGISAITEITACHMFHDFSVLFLLLRTGRTHQIRVHCAHLGFPLLGDTLYGDATQLIKRHALHAAHVVFTHPYTADTIHVHCPLPADMQAVLTDTKL